MKKGITSGFISAVTIMLFTSANVVEGLAVNKLHEMKYLTNSDHTQMPPVFPNTQQKQIAKSDDAVSLTLSLKDGNTCRIGSRSKRYVISGTRWRFKDLTYKIRNYPKRLKKSDVDAEIARAFNVWSEYTPLNFTAKSNGSVHIDISFDDIENGDPFDGPGKILARSYYPGTGSGGDVYFDIAEHWTIGKSRGINLFLAAAHEIGHALGLSHSDKNSALMAPNYKGFNPQFKLDDDDISAIQALYGKKNVTRSR